MSFRFKPAIALLGLCLMALTAASCRAQSAMEANSAGQDRTAAAPSGSQARPSSGRGAQAAYYGASRWIAGASSFGRNGNSGVWAARNASFGRSGNGSWRPASRNSALGAQPGGIWRVPANLSSPLAAANSANGADLLAAPGNAAGSFSAAIPALSARVAIHAQNRSSVFSHMGLIQHPQSPHASFSSHGYSGSARRFGRNGASTLMAARPHFSHTAPPLVSAPASAPGLSGLNMGLDSGLATGLAAAPLDPGLSTNLMPSPQTGIDSGAAGIDSGLSTGGNSASQ